MYHPRLKGKHYDMGKHYGELLAKSGVDLSDVIRIPQNQTAFGLSCLPIYEQYLPSIMKEVRGLADGLGQRYEAVACWLFALYCFESDHGCSVFAVHSGEHTILVGIWICSRNIKRRARVCSICRKIKISFLLTLQL